jgi:hypothetical protein
MIPVEKNPDATIIAAAEPKDTPPSGDARHAVASQLCRGHRAARQQVGYAELGGQVDRPGNVDAPDHLKHRRSGCPLFLGRLGTGSARTRSRCPVQPSPASAHDCPARRRHHRMRYLIHGVLPVPPDTCAGAHQAESSPDQGKAPARRAVPDDLGVAASTDPDRSAAPARYARLGARPPSRHRRAGLNVLQCGHGSRPGGAGFPFFGCLNQPR